MSAGICPEISIFQGGEWCLLPPCTESGMTEKQRQLRVKDVFIYRTVS